MAHKAVSEELKSVGDVGAFSIVIATLIEILPAASAVLSVCYISIRIYETDTVRRLLRKRK